MDKFRDHVTELYKDYYVFAKQAGITNLESYKAFSSNCYTARAQTILKEIKEKGKNKIQ